MTITLHWDDADQTIIRYDLVGHWTWDEYHVVFTEALERFRATTERIDCIADFTHAVGVPTGAMTKTREAFTQMPPHVGYVIFCGGSLIVNSLTMTFARVYPKYGSRLLVAKTLADARRLIADKRAAGQMPIIPQRGQL